MGRKGNSMAIFTENIGKVSVGEPVSWDRDAALLYALSIGAGRPDATDGIEYTTENSFGIQQKVFPTFAVILGGSGGSMDHLGDFKLHQILHGGQSLVLHCELTAQGIVTPRSYMSAVYDQGKNAIIELTTELADPEGQLVATSVTSMVIRGENGYGPRPEAAGGWTWPEGEPESVIEQATSVDQALLYRLNGDRNPLHSDPVMASKVGFPKASAAWPVHLRHGRPRAVARQQATVRARPGFDHRTLRRSGLPGTGIGNAHLEHR